ncbi:MULTISPECIES: cupin domain-containing protein [Pedobacter]|uniref:cupin domain-containing protein n=1 Tax=Pedobacter TaxID=84567 RepID=UPI001E3541C8|nr:MULTISPECIES: cupin domain-containing protein [Pedobacter]
MKNLFLKLFTLILLLAFPILLNAQESGATSINSQKKQNNFTGIVSVKMHTESKNNLDCTLGTVSFEPGARTNWHKHTGGQILLITEGTAYYQERGSKKRILEKGESVTCSPNVAHWHGAAAKSKMTHVAVGPNSNRGAVVWLEKVNDSVYSK